MNVPVILLQMLGMDLRLSGKTVTLIEGLRMNPSDLKAYAGKLKKKTGTGGSLKDGVIEIQGDYRDKVGGILKKDGWEVRNTN